MHTWQACARQMGIFFRIGLPILPKKMLQTLPSILTTCTKKKFQFFNAFRIAAKLFIKREFAANLSEGI